MIIHAADITLLQLKADHAETLFGLVDEHRNDLRTWLPWVPGHRELSDTEAFIERVSRKWEQRDGFHVGIWLHDDTLVGICGLSYVDWVDRIAGVECWVAPPWQRKEIASKSVHALRHYAFEEYMINRIEARLPAGNKGAEKLFKGLKFEYEGTLREAQILENGFIDHKVYSLLHSEWPAVRDRWTVEISSMGPRP